MQYIYIDTKILGSIYQLIEYFQSKVFSKEKTIVYIKKYKECAESFVKLLKKHKIKTKFFTKYSEINMVDNSVVFYLFNAQSNCRIVANRQLIHIFVTHGESNKAASIKPIIRIYDYIICAGMMSVNRFINHKIFYQDDVQRKRLIMMGDTFIGQNNYSLSESGHILYSPTWEGGIPEENYSSLQWGVEVFEKLFHYLSIQQKSTIVIQPHPNLGHRDKKYPMILSKGIKFLNANNIKVVLVTNQENNLKRWLLKIKSRGNLVLKPKNSLIKISEAFCDISAMEAQLNNNFIPTRVFWSHHSSVEELKDQFLIDYYLKTAIFRRQDIIENYEMSNDFYNYIFDYSYKSIQNESLENRVEWLIDFVR